MELSHIHLAIHTELQKFSTFANALHKMCNLYCKKCVGLYDFLILIHVKRIFSLNKNVQVSSRFGKYYIHCIVLHIFRQVLFCAGNWGNHQNFEKAFLAKKYWELGKLKLPVFLKWPFYFIFFIFFIFFASSQCK